MATNDGLRKAFQGVGIGIETISDFRSLYSADALARRAKALSNTQIGYDRYTSGIAMSGAYRAGVGAQQSALGSQGIAGGDTSRLFALQSQLELQSAQGANNMALLQRTEQARIARAAATDARVSGVGKAVTNLATSAFSLFGPQS